MRFLILFILIISHTALFSQQTWGDDGEIEDAEVIIEKDRKIELPPASRNYEKVPPLPMDKDKTAEQYKFGEFKYELQPIDPRIRILTIQEDPLPKLYGNYVKAGFGNYTTPYLEAFINNKRNDKYSAGAHFKHLSSRNGPVDDENSGTSENELSVFGKYFTKPLTFSGDISYSRDKYFFYGYDQNLEVDRDSIKQVFNTISLSAAMENNKADSDLQYKLTTSFNFLKDNFEAREGVLGVNLAGKYKMSDLLSVTLKSDLYLSQKEDTDKIDRNLFRLNPSFQTTVDQFEISVGVNLVYEDDTLDNADKLHFYPVAEAGYYLTDEIKAYAGIGGDIQRKSLQKFVDENPFVAPNVPVFNTNKTFEFYGGVQGKFWRKFNFITGLSIGNYKNMFYFVNSESDSSKFDIFYETSSTSLLNIFGELGFVQTEVFHGTFRADFYNYGTDELEEPWHKPQYKLSLLTHYNLFNKILFNADFILMGGIKGLNLQSGNSKELDGIVDINLKADYLLSDRASVFIKLNNILSNNNERFLNYPSREIMVMAGLTYAF